MKKVLILLSAFCLSSSAFALNWQMVGARSMAMGGVGVVTAEGTNAQYYNPALLGVVDGDEYAYYDAIHIGVQTENPKLASESSATAAKGFPYIKDLMKKGYGSFTNADVGFGIRRGNFGFSIRSLETLAVTPQTGTRATIEGMAFTEANFGYGFHLFEGVRIGGNLKVIEGTSIATGFLWNNDEAGFGGLMKRAWRNKKFSTSWGIDLGAAVNLSDLFQGNFLFNPEIGITAKNLNTPKFKRYDVYSLKYTYKLKPQYRLGAAIHPIDRLTIAGDLDLNKNETLIEGYDSRQIAGGVEYLVVDRHTFQIPLRAGINKNLVEDDAPTYFTAGFGAIGHVFDFELGLTIGDKMIKKIDKNKWPNAMGLAMSFSWYF